MTPVFLELVCTAGEDSISINTTFRFENAERMYAILEPITPAPTIEML